MSYDVYSDKYLDLNAKQTKRLSLVVKIDGLDDVLSVVPIYHRISYGDPGVEYGDEGLYYGGFRLIDNVKPYISLESGGITITQKIEPEQGRGAISTITLGFVDKDGYMSRLISPGILLEEPMGNNLVTIYVGYIESSYPEDYYPVFRGYMTDFNSGAGMVRIQFSDANVKRKQQVCSPLPTELASSINSVVTTIPVVKTDSLYDHVLGPDGSYDGSVRTYIKIDDEWMEYGPGDLSTNSINVIRGGGSSRGTTPDAHTSGATVENGIEITGNAIDIALKMMMSGLAGPWIEDVSAVALGTNLNVVNPRTDAIFLGTDSDREYGLAIGDWLTISGSTAGNDGDYRIIGFQDYTDLKNQVILIDQVLSYENPSTSVMLAFRSQFDTLPILCGSKNNPREVDVRSHVNVRDTYLSQSSNRMRFFISSEISSLKTFIESQCFLPLGLYGLTKYGRLSVGVTQPPIADDKLIYLDERVILNPESITINRATNNRKFFNVVQYKYDSTDDGEFKKILNILDSESLSKTSILSVLPIESLGLKASLGATNAVNRRGLFLLNRYKQGAFEVDIKVNWAAGSLLETGDVVALVDNGTLKITNFDTGERDLGIMLFEVIERKTNLKDGNVSLKLLSNLGIKIGQRFATISPSSLVTSGSTTSEIMIQDSFGSLYPGDEKRKWARFSGLPILVHNYDWSDEEETTLTGFDPVNPYKMLVDPPLSFTPAAGYIVDVGTYPSSDDEKENALYKTLFWYLDPTLTVVTGISSTQFTVSAGDALKLNVGLPIQIHNADYSIESPERDVTDVTGVTVTVETDLGFTPSAGQRIELVGFKDGLGPYRFL